MDKADVVIVGAGPAGSSAAFFLAQQGIEVVLIDKSHFPREKACGDGLGPRAIQIMNKMGLGNWLASGSYYRCNRVRMVSSMGSRFEAHIPAEDTPYPYFYIVSRRDLDHKLVETASSAGARVYMGHKAVFPVVSNGTVKGVRTSCNGEETEISCKILVCADGTNGSFAKYLGLQSVKPHAFAARAYFSNVKGLDDCINIYIDERIPEGYAWIFPVSETTANIGLGVSCPKMKQLDVDVKRLIRWFVSEKDTSPIDLSDAAAATDIKGAHLRMGYGRYKSVADGVLLVGDSAGLINPLTGEGIAYALESGEQAALVIRHAFSKGDISERALMLYQNHLNKNFYMNHRVYELIRFGLANYTWMDKLIKKGAKHPELAAKFTSIMMSTAKPSSIFMPKMLRCMLF
ncbi:MAG: geranylgeranyl reductase family protein [Actinomycetota bacterium]